MKTSTCSICGHTYDEPFADIFGGPSRCPKCHPYVPGTAKGETEEELAAMECEQSVIRPVEDKPARTWRCTDGYADIDIEASTAQEAAEFFVLGGDWEPEPSTWWCHVTCTPIDKDGEEIEDEAEDIAVAMDPDEPECADGEHDWRSPEWLGGCDTNPGVWGHGGGVKSTEVCSKCGLYRITDTWAQDQQTGEQGLESVEYREADGDSLEWAESMRGEENE